MKSAKKLSITDYINHKSFKKIEDKGTYFMLHMDSIERDNKYYALDPSMRVNTSTYFVSFLKENI